MSASALLLGLWLNARQWKRDLEWKREESRARKQREFTDRVEQFQTLRTRAAIMMLPNYDRDVQLREGGPTERVSWEEASKALIPARHRRYLYEPKLIRIRDCFNEMLQNLARLKHLEARGLVRSEDLDHIARPIILRIAKTPQASETPLARNLRLYIHWAKHERVLELFRRYDCEIDSRKAADRTQLQLELRRGDYGPSEPSSWGEY